MKEKDEELEKLKREKMEEIMEKDESPNNSEYPNSPIKLTDSNFQEKINEYSLLVVDFWADWCAPCKAIAPIIEELAEKYSGDIVFGKMNIDQNKRTPQKFGVSGIPTLLVVKNGEPVDKIVGMAPQEQLEKKLRQYID